MVYFVSKKRIGNYVFIDWIGDHDPARVHIYKDGRLICKWDLENDRVMSGKCSRRLRELIGTYKKLTKAEK